MRLTWPIFRITLAWLALTALSVFAGSWAAWRHREALLAEIKEVAARCAVAFATPDVNELAGSPTDADTEAYRAVKRRLQRLRAINPSVRFVYLFRAADFDGGVVFLADSEPEGSPDESKPGDAYPEALNSPGLQAILRYGETSTEGPLRDSFGEWVTAYASVGTPVPGAPRVVLGVDLDASRWKRAIWREGVIGAAYVWLLLGLPFGVWLLLRRERRFTRDIVRFSAAMQQSHSGILITDLERRIEYANSGSAAATGYTVAELIGQPARCLLPRDMDDQLRLKIVALALGGERWQGELQVRKKNGDVFPARAVVSPVRDSSGRITSLVMVFDDISDLKRTEAELRVARDQAQSADRAKGEFLAVMSHELRTPLNGIIGFASLLALTNELLDYSRIDAGRLSLDPQPCSPRQIVEETVELLSTRAAEKNLELITTVAPATPALVLADPGRLRQVLVNLVNNAIKFTPAGEVEVAVDARLEDDDENGPRVRLEFSVRDTGIGIASEQQQRLFQPFSQVDASSTRRHGGAGLGLAISRSLVLLMEGDIEVASAAGAGSVFRFHIFTHLIEAAAPLEELPRRRVALVSANRRAREYYASLLEGWGLTVEACENLPALKTESARDLILVDMLARDADLWPALIRAHPALSCCTLVGLAPVTISATARDDLRGSFHTVLKKPVREPLLHALLKSLLKT